MENTDGKNFQCKLKQKRSACSFGLRTALQESRPAVGPGPLQYTVPPALTRFGRNTTPSFSMGQRHRSQVGSSTPGPGMYNPESSHSMKKFNGPAFSLTGRTSISTYNNTPGPNAYTLPNAIGNQNPKSLCGAVRITGRPKDKNEHTNRSPGPASYGLPNVDAYKAKTPQYSMSGRRIGPFDATKKQGPSPCTYSLPSAVPGNSQPGYSFGVRHSQQCANFISQNDN